MKPAGLEWLDRMTPVSHIVAVEGGTENASRTHKVDDDARIARLEREGTLSRRSPESPLTVLGPPVRADAGILDALLEERSEERRERSR